MDIGLSGHLGRHAVPDAVVVHKNEREHAQTQNLPMGELLAKVLQCRRLIVQETVQVSNKI